MAEVTKTDGRREAMTTRDEDRVAIASSWSRPRVLASSRLIA